MKIKEILQIVESYAPSALQAEYDNSGLQIGFPEDEVRGVLLCVDVTPQARTWSYPIIPCCSMRSNA